MISTSVSVLLLALVGLVMFSYYSDCDPLANKAVQRADQVSQFKFGVFFSHKITTYNIFLTFEHEISK